MAWVPDVKKIKAYHFIILSMVVLYSQIICYINLYSTVQR